MRSDPTKFLEAMGNFVHIACDTSRAEVKERQQRYRDQDAHPGSLANVSNICMDDPANTSDNEQAATGWTQQADARRASQAAEPDEQQPARDGPESGSQEEQPQGESALKSLGSAGHPDHCQAECVFHFFRGGCKGGINCRFCHEFHPRKNPKKNRRALRRFIANAGSAEEAHGGSSVDEFSSVCNNYDELPPSRADLPRRQVSDTPSVPAGDCLERREFAPDAEREGLVKISYGQDQAVALLTGVRLRLAPQVDISPDCQSSERPNLQFSVEPSLPAGLSLSSTSGEISGIPNECVSNQAYTVTVGTEAIGLGSMKLGLVPIASTTLSLTVVELQAYTATWGTEDEEGRLKIVLQKDT
jgi:hypothetical protein